MCQAIIAEKTGTPRERIWVHVTHPVTTMHEPGPMGPLAAVRRRRKRIAQKSGCIMLVFNTDFEEDNGYILDALHTGLLTEERLDEAVTRILALKAKACFQRPCEEKIEAEAWHRECADKAITLGKDEILDGSVQEITAVKFMYWTQLIHESLCFYV